MKFGWCVLVGGLLLADVFGLHAEEREWSYFFNAAQLHERCSSNDEADKIWCEGYVAGVLDAFGGSTDPAGDAAELAGCFSRQITLRQSKDVVISTLEGLYADAGDNLTMFPAARAVLAGVSVELCR